MARTKSPMYPSYPLSRAMENIRKIFDADRTATLPREVIAKHLGYSGLSGASDKNIGTLGQYGLLEKIGKGEMKVSQLAVDILLSESPESNQLSINQAALMPPLFKDIWNHFEKQVPSDDALKTFLLRREFNDRAIDPVMKSFAPTMAMLKLQNETESGGIAEEPRAGSEVPPTVNNNIVGVNASVGDYIQWESLGSLQFEEPQRVRWVSDEGDWLSVEGSNTGIPMSEVTIEQTAAKVPPIVPPLPDHDLGAKREAGFTEWFRAKVGADKLVTINYKGNDDIGPREIEKMIAILEAQKLALED